MQARVPPLGYFLPTVGKLKPRLSNVTVPFLLIRSTDSNASSFAQCSLKQLASVVSSQDSPVMSDFTAFEIIVATSSKKAWKSTTYKLDVTCYIETFPQTRL
eukprot:2946326-Amphidinium_carterae.2